jgi:hypothetical protein
VRHPDERDHHRAEEVEGEGRAGPVGEELGDGDFVTVGLAEVVAMAVTDGTAVLDDVGVASGDGVGDATTV